MNLTFRKARSDDTDEIMTFVKAAVEKLDSLNIFQWDDIYPAREDFDADIAEGTAFVAEAECKESGTENADSGKKIAAVFVLNKECEEQYKSGEWNYTGSDFVVIHRLCVNPEFQHKGIGTLVCRHIIDSSRANGTKAIRLDAFTENPFALNMYKNLGFTVVGTADWRKGKFILMEKTL